MVEAALRGHHEAEQERPDHHRRRDQEADDLSRGVELPLSGVQLALREFALERAAVHSLSGDFFRPHSPNDPSEGGSDPVH